MGYEAQHIASRFEILVEKAYNFQLRKSWMVNHDLLKHTFFNKIPSTTSNENQEA